jgi:hypothetical protein
MNSFLDYLIYYPLFEAGEEMKYTPGTCLAVRFYDISLAFPTPVILSLAE